MFKMSGSVRHEPQRGVERNAPIKEFMLCGFSSCVYGWVEPNVVDVVVAQHKDVLLACCSHAEVDVVELYTFFWLRAVN